jgi:hypothetical protein
MMIAFANTLRVSVGLLTAAILIWRLSPDNAMQAKDAWKEWNQPQTSQPALTESNPQSAPLPETTDETPKPPTSSANDPLESWSK